MTSKEVVRFIASIKKEMKMMGLSSIILNVLFQPLLYLFVFGPLIGKLIPAININNISMNYFSYMFSGIIVINGFLIGIRAGATLILEKNNGGLETSFSLPISRNSLYLSKLFSTLIQSLLGFSVLFGIGILFVENVHLSLVGMFEIITIYFIGTLITASFMIFLSSVIKKPDLPVALANLIFLPLMMFSNVFYPKNVSDNPALQTIIFINPISQINIIIRDSLFGFNTNTTYSWIYLGVIFVISYILGLIKFKRIMMMK